LMLSCSLWLSGCRLFDFAADDTSLDYIVAGLSV
jgi:hypothetical protein